ncbi:MAG: response regulator [Candidatus Omnitrophica bacterium]|nr:response regulator [Candidatus Omnitrophota bacterium]
MKTLLIIDDEAGIIEEVQSFFTEEGFDVQTAETGEDGLRLIKETKPDILLLDMKLPDIHGLTILKLCKEISPKTKIIVNTGYVDQGMVDEAEKIGRDAFLLKPFNLLHLKEEIDRLLN